MTPPAWVATPEQAEVVAGLIVDFRGWYGRDWPSDESIRASVDRLIAGPDAEFLLGAPSPGAPAAGFCQLRFRHSVWMATYDCWMEDLYVRDESQNLGIGTALIRLALERARERGCRRMELDVTEDNLGARALYRRLGFSEYTKTTPPVHDLFIGISLRD